MSAARIQHGDPLRVPLLFAALAVGAALALAIAGRITGAHETDPGAKVLTDRALRFDDVLAGPGAGTIAVTDAANSRTIATIGVGRDNFLRATMRGLARERFLEGKGPEVPFHLMQWDDGRLTLLDPVSGRAVELNAFGPDNRASFAKLLTARDGDTQ